MPIGVDVQVRRGDRAVTARMALERARAVRDLAGDVDLTGLEGFGEAVAGVGYLMPRPDGEAVTIFSDAPPAALADRLQEASEIVPLTARNQSLLEAFRQVLGVDAPSGPGSDPVQSCTETQGSMRISDALVPGAWICFTGEPVHDGRAWGRGEMEDLAADRGLMPVANVTKTRCDVLVCAEAGTRSGKAKNAAKWGKPVFTADEFFTWLDGGSDDVTGACAVVGPDVVACVVPLG